MNRFKLKEACLLDLSGELSAGAKGELEAYLGQNPAARRIYESIRRDFEFFQGLPVAELSAQQGEGIPEAIKQALQEARAGGVQQRRGGRRVLRLSGAVWSVAAAMGVAASVSFAIHAYHVRQSNLATINDMLEAASRHLNEPATPYEQAVQEVDASIDELQTESPTLAQMHNDNMNAFVNAIINVSQETPSVNHHRAHNSY